MNKPTIIFTPLVEADGQSQTLITVEGCSIMEARKIVRRLESDEFKRGNTVFHQSHEKPNDEL